MSNKFKAGKQYGFIVGDTKFDKKKWDETMKARKKWENAEDRNGLGGNCFIGSQCSPGINC